MGLDLKKNNIYIYIYILSLGDGLWLAGNRHLQLWKECIKESSLSSDSSIHFKKEWDIKYVFSVIEKRYNFDLLHITISL
jgi:hypothetical protein